jgi:hypothetical protein
MRARNIKPGFFRNEQLAECPVEARLLFAGLWCMADRAGRLEDRPKRIKIELFPGDSFDVDVLLEILGEHQLIHRYQVGEARYIQVLNFTKHQHPHQKEPPSTIPESGASPVPVPDKPDTGTGAARLIPDSGFLNPDCLLRKGTWFAEIREAYPKRAGGQGWRKAEMAANARVSEGHAPADILAGVKRYASFCEGTGKIGTELVKQAQTFLGPENFFLESWDLPKQLTTTQFKTREQQMLDDFARQS